MRHISWARALSVLLAVGPAHVGTSRCPVSTVEGDDGLTELCICDETANFKGDCTTATVLTGCSCECAPGYALNTRQTLDTDGDEFIEFFECVPCPTGFRTPEGDATATECEQCDIGPGARTHPERYGQEDVLGSVCQGCQANWVSVTYTSGAKGCECNTNGGYELSINTNRGADVEVYRCTPCANGTYHEPSRLRYDVDECDACPEPVDADASGPGLTSASDCVCAHNYVNTLVYFANGENGGDPVEVQDPSDADFTAYLCRCPAGHEPVFNNALNYDTCEPCETGYYKPDAGNHECTSCGEYFYTEPLTGSTSADACLCAANMEAAEVAPDSGGPGSSEGAVRLCVCSAGFELQCPDKGLGCDEASWLATPANRDSLCQACADGYFKEAAGNEECEDCPDFATTGSVGAASPGTCACPEGMELNEDGDACICSGGFVTTESGSCEACPLNEYKESAASTSCRACPGGLITLDTGAGSRRDCVCDTGYYINVTDWSVFAVTCELCPTGLICPAGTAGPEDMGVQQGYWRYSRRSMRAYACEANPAACAGASAGADAGGDGVCVDGHVGPRCAACDLGWGRDTNGSCIECPPRSAAEQDAAAARQRERDVGIICAAAVILFVVVGIMSRIVTLSGRAGGFSEDKADDLVPLAKIVINYLQLTSFSLAFKLDWSDAVLGLLQWMRQVAMPISLQLRAVDCEIGAGDERSWLKFVAYVSGVPVMVAAWAIFWACVAAAAVARGPAYAASRGLHSRREVVLRQVDSFKVTVLVLLFIVHMPLTEETLKLLNCEALEDVPGGRTYLHLVDRPSILCSEAPHNWRMVVAGICFGCYGLGIPLAGAVLLWRNRARFRDPSFIAVYGFLFRGFEQTDAKRVAMFWEVLVVMPRKVVFTMLQVLLAQVPVLAQTLTAVYFLFIVVLLHTRYEPYANPSLDRIESLSLVASFTTLFLGVFFRLSRDELGDLPQVSETLTALVIAIQAAMAVVFTHAVLAIVVPQKVRWLKDRLAAQTMAASGPVRRVLSPARSLGAGGGATVTDDPSGHGASAKKVTSKDSQVVPVKDEPPSPGCAPPAGGALAASGPAKAVPVASAAAAGGSAPAAAGGADDGGGGTAGRAVTAGNGGDIDDGIAISSTSPNGVKPADSLP